MAGIYIHIPFCKQACNYCDFHFSTQHKIKSELVTALIKELGLQKEFLSGSKVETIYLGGGTPSILTIDELQTILDAVYDNFDVIINPEITLEANPDDLSAIYLKQLRHTPVNRLSIGVQSFRDEDLKSFNRAHDSKQALRCVPESADLGFERISIDLIYGMPTLSFDDWKNNLAIAYQLPINHLSAYSLTIEEGTALSHQVNAGKYPKLNDDHAANQFEYLQIISEENNFPWYEISNLSKPGCESIHNSNYWNYIPYLGIGPSAHSFNGTKRSWNVRNNYEYLKGISENKISAKSEVLTENQRFNEYIMIGLRTRKGINLMQIEQKFGKDFTKNIQEKIYSIIEGNLAILDSNNLSLTTKGLLLSDKIIEDLIIV